MPGKSQPNDKKTKKYNINDINRTGVMMKKIVVMMLFAFSAFTLMSGCSSDSTPADPTLSGTAATGAPIDGTVTVKDAKGVEKNIGTNVDGSFTLDVTGMTAPYLLRVMPSSGPALYSYASQNGQTVNLTPTTNLAMFLAAGQTDLDAMYTDWNGTAVSAAQVAIAEGTVRANLITQMEAASLDVANYDLFTSAFAADGSGIDGVLDDLIIAVDASANSFTFTDRSGTDLGWDGALTPPAPTTGGSGTLSHADINGTWKKCGIDGANSSFTTEFTLNNGTATYTNNLFTGTVCAGAGTSDGGGAFTYVIGGNVTLNAPPANTIVAEFDLTFTGELTEYNVIAVDKTSSPARLYFGDTENDPAFDGSTPEKRATVTEAGSFEKQ